MRILVAVALIVTALPLPVLAQGSKQSPPRPGLQASIAPAVRVVATTAPSKAADAQAQPADKSQLESTSFFKKPAGMVVLAVMAAGVGYAVYSAKHDRIPPTGR